MAKIIFFNGSRTGLIIWSLYFVGDRYDEEPASTGGGGGGSSVSSTSGRSKYRLDEIDDWETGNKSIATEAVDKVKGLWNKVQGRRGPDDIVDYRWGTKIVKSDKTVSGYIIWKGI